MSRVSTALNDCWNRIGVQGDASCPELTKYVHCRNCPVYSGAAVQLLDSDLPAEHLNFWTSHFSEVIEDRRHDAQSVVIFRIATEWLALPTVVFREVAEFRVCHSLPHRRGGIILGVVNIRGELLVCVSLAQILGLDSAAQTKASNPRAARRRLMVVSDEGNRAVFPVDEVHGTHRFSPAELKEVPATVSKAAATYARAILPWEGKAIGLLDEGLLFHTLNKNLG